MESYKSTDWVTGQQNSKSIAMDTQNMVEHIANVVVELAAIIHKNNSAWPI